VRPQGSVGRGGREGGLNAPVLALEDTVQTLELFRHTRKILTVAERVRIAQRSTLKEETHA
jgi:hypothetical protein